MSISFNKICFEKINFETKKDAVFPQGGVPAALAVNISTTINKNKKTLKLSMGIELNGQDNKSFPFKCFNISLTGYFALKPDGDIKDLEKFAITQAPALLFPYIREAISDITMRAGFPPLILPPSDITKLIGINKPPIKQPAKKA